MRCVVIGLDDPSRFPQVANPPSPFPDPHPKKVERQRDVAERNWLMVNDTLPEELPKLYESRVDFFDPCLQGLLLSEMRYFRNLLTNLETLTMDCDISVRSGTLRGRWHSLV